MVISASRRTDIPAFFADDFMRWIRAGFCIVRNPYSGKESRVELNPQTVDGIVFWTKNPKQMMPYLDELSERGYHYYFQFTLTPYDGRIEPKLPPKQELLRTFQELSQQIGKEKVIWRYDPIIFSDELGLTGKWHFESFTKLADSLAPYTEQCIISYMDFYGKCLKRPECRAFREPSETEMLELAGFLTEIARSRGLHINACAEKLDLSSVGVGRAHCVDAELLERITGNILSLSKDKGQRKECGCAVSRDIGSYGNCPHGCVYCYAN